MRKTTIVLSLLLLLFCTPSHAVGYIHDITTGIMHNAADVYETDNTTTVQTTLDSIEVYLSTSADDLDSIEVKLSEFDDEITALEVNDDSIEVWISGADLSIETLEIDMDSAEIVISLHETDINTLQTDVDSIEVNLSNTAVELGTIEAKLSYHAVELDTIEAKLSYHSVELGTIEAKLSANNVRMTSDEVKLSLHQIAINACATIAGNNTFTGTNTFQKQITGTIENALTLGSSTATGVQFNNSNKYIRNNGAGIKVSYADSSFDASTARGVKYLGYAGEALTKDDVVYSNGAFGDKPYFFKAHCTIETEMARVSGIAMSSVALNAYVYTIDSGFYNMDTSAFSAGDMLYVSTTGTLQNTAPTVGKVVRIGHVVKVGVADGYIHLTSQKMRTKLYDDVGSSTTCYNVSINGGTAISSVLTGDSLEIAFTGTQESTKIYADSDTVGTTGANVTVSGGTAITSTRTGDSLEIAFSGVQESTTASNAGTVGDGVFYQKTLVDLEMIRLHPQGNITFDTTEAGLIKIGTTATVGEANTASNYGAVGDGLWYDKNGVDLRFGRIHFGSGLTADTSEAGIMYLTASGAGEVNTASNTLGGDGVWLEKSGVDLVFKGLRGGTNITLDTTEANLITINGAAASGGQTLYDVIVAPSGGDYTSLSVATDTEAAGTTFYVRNGTYNEASFIKLESGDSIIGESAGGVIIDFDGTSTNDCIYSFGAAVDNRNEKIQIVNIDVVDCASGSTGAVSLKWTDSAILKNVNAYNNITTTRGINLNDCDNCFVQSDLLENASSIAYYDNTACKTNEIRLGTVNGACYIGSGGSNVYINEIHNVGASGIVCSSTSSTIGFGSIQACTTYGISLSGSMCKVSGTLIKNVKDYGAYISGNTNEVSISTISDVAGGGVYLTSDYNTVMVNTITGCVGAASDGLQLNGADYNRIEVNEIKKCGRYGAYLSSSNTNEVTVNEVSGNGDNAIRVLTSDSVIMKVGSIYHDDASDAFVIGSGSDNGSYTIASLVTTQTGANGLSQNGYNSIFSIGLIRGGYKGINNSGSYCNYNVGKLSGASYFDFFSATRTNILMSGDFGDVDMGNSTYSVMNGVYDSITNVGGTGFKNNGQEY